MVTATRSVSEICLQARAAARTLAALDSDTKDAALHAIADALIVGWSAAGAAEELVGVRRRRFSHRHILALHTLARLSLAGSVWAPTQCVWRIPRDATS